MVQIQSIIFMRNLFCYLFNSSVRAIEYLIGLISDAFVLFLQQFNFPNYFYFFDIDNFYLMYANCNWLLHILMFLILIFVFILPFFFNSYYSIFFFILSISLSCIIFYFLKVYFLALILFIIYSGAIPILILFLVKTVGNTTKDSIFVFNYMLLKIFLFINLFLFFSFVVNYFFWTTGFMNYYYVFFKNSFLLNFFDINFFLKPGLDSLDINFIKDYFYINFFLEFIISTFLLIVSMVGSISIVLKK